MSSPDIPGVIIRDVADPDFRDSLPSDAENYDTYCERCQLVHRYYAFTKEDYDRTISEAAGELRAAIDAKVLADIGDVYKR